MKARNIQGIPIEIAFLTTNSQDAIFLDEKLEQFPGEVIIKNEAFEGDTPKLIATRKESGVEIRPYRCHLEYVSRRESSSCPSFLDIGRSMDFTVSGTNYNFRNIPALQPWPYKEA